MLKGIPPILSPELLKILCEMGHGDYIVLADGNFPSETIGKRVIRGDGHGIPEYLDAILQLLPLDTYVEHPVGLMQVVPGDDVKTLIWDTYREILQKHDKRTDLIDQIERFAFYEKAKGAYAVLATGETAIYGNIILQKGVVKA